MAVQAQRRLLARLNQQPKATARRKPTPRGPATALASPAARRARRKFLRVFPDGFRDETYLDWERAYKWQAHERWQEVLAEPTFSRLLKKGQFGKIATAAIRIESRTNLLFSFEKMALRDALKTPDATRTFARGLFSFLYGAGTVEARFDAWVKIIDALPRRQTRVLTWPLATVFGFIAEPKVHFFFKPLVTREAARRYGRELPYEPRPSGRLYRSLLEFVHSVRRDIHDLRPRDMIDIQSFLWVQGSDEYSDW